MSMQLYMKNSGLVQTNDIEKGKKAQTRIDPSHKSHEALDKYPTMHHFVAELCTSVGVMELSDAILYELWPVLRNVELVWRFGRIKWCRGRSRTGVVRVSWLNLVCGLMLGDRVVICGALAFTRQLFRWAECVTSRSTRLDAVVEVQGPSLACWTRSTVNHLDVALNVSSCKEVIVSVKRC